MPSSSSSRNQQFLILIMIQHVLILENFQKKKTRINPRMNIQTRTRIEIYVLQILRVGKAVRRKPRTYSMLEKLKYPCIHTCIHTHIQ